MKVVNEKEFDASIKSGVTLVDFYADWCGPCKMVAPVLEGLSKDYEGKANFIKVDVDVEQALAQKFGVMSIPTLIVFKDGAMVKQVVGFQSKANLEIMLKAII